METLKIQQPDDWHIHLREGIYLQRTVSDAAAQFHRALVMPNLETPVTSIEQARRYRAAILSEASGQNFEPYMTLYLNESLKPETIQQVAAEDFILAIKLYPAGATTLSEQGVRNIQAIYPQLAALEKAGLVLCVHGEVTNPEVDIFDREAVFIEQVLLPIINDFPDLKIVLEHITTKTAVDFILSTSDKLAATITAHHLWINRNDLLVGGIKPHYYCLPIVKTQQDQQSLIKAATSGNPKFFLGTDSAPRAINKKESACGCAGIYTAHAAIELYATIFERANALDKLNDFASFGARFYGLTANTQQITLKKQIWSVPDKLSFGSTELVPFQANQTLDWQLIKDE